MIANLNGWQRLWVLLCALWLIAVSVGGFLTFPSLAKLSHEKVFEDRLKPESRARLAVPDSNGVIWDDEVGAAIEEPNGHILRVKKGLKEEEIVAVAEDYKRILERQVKKNGIAHGLMMLAYWTVPSMLIYLLGWTVGWVYRGFKKTAS